MKKIKLTPPKSVTIEPETVAKALGAEPAMPVARPMKPIPIRAAQGIAEMLGYDQVVIYARRVGDDPEPHGEHMTTYGTTPEHCEAAARMGEYLKYDVMGWDKKVEVDHGSTAIVKSDGQLKLDILNWVLENQETGREVYDSDIMLKFGLTRDRVIALRTQLEEAGEF